MNTQVMNTRKKIAIACISFLAGAGIVLAETVTGVTNDGSALPSPLKPVIFGGTDGTNVRAAAVVVDGAPVSVSLGYMIMGGKDGSGNAKPFLFDSASRVTIRGAGNAGGAITGFGLETLGSDGVTARNFLVDSSGRSVVIGAGAPGVAPVGNPVFVAGVGGDGATHSLPVSLGGGAQVPGGSYVAVCGTDGALARGFLTDTSGRQPAGDTTKTTYSTCAAAFAPAATASDVFTITGSGTKTVKVRKLSFSATQTTAGTFEFFLAKRSTANSGGTSTNLVEVSYDSTNAAATATTLSYTVNPTPGTLVGNIAAIKAFVPVTTTAAAAPVYEFFYGNLLTQPVTLRGTGEVLALNLNGVTLTGGSIVCYAEWTEE